MTQKVKLKYKDAEFKLCSFLINPWAGGITFKKIYILKKYWNSLITVEQDELLEHEYIHVLQQRKVGAFKWFIKYIFSDTFRIQQEIDAYLPEILLEIKRTGEKSMTLRKYATVLSGDTYLESIEYEQALKVLIEKIG